MNIDQAKQIDIVQLLERTGHSPTLTRKHQCWYISPLRAEQDASFVVNTATNRWVDYGDGRHGDVIDLVIQLYQLNSVSEALAQLKHLVGSAPLPTIQPSEIKPPVPAIQITDIRPVTSNVLIQYLRQRGIDPSVSGEWIKEVHYQTRGKRYFAIGFENAKGGFELRNRYFKGCTSKDLTVIPGDPDRVMVFEGFCDFLTAVTRRAGRLKSTSIVLNSVAMKDKAIRLIHELHAGEIELYRDNDQAGEHLLSFFRQQLPDATIEDKAQQYLGYKDLNEWHMANMSPTRLASAPPMGR